MHKQGVGRPVDTRAFLKGFAARACMLVPALGLALAGSARAAEAPPSEAVLQQVLTAQLKKLKPDWQRSVVYQQVRRVSSQGGYHRFTVTATTHDYNPGYPANRYYGETCLGKFTNEPIDMRRGPGGEWIVQGRLTPPTSDCKNNPSQGVSAFPLAQLAGSQAATAPVPGVQAARPTGGQLYVGEYACYGTMGRMMTGMGFRLSGGRYADLDGKRGGSYAYNPAAGTIKFNGGFMSGQTGSNVTNAGFQVSSTVNCEPWR
jgi:hypothetical protein